MTGIIKGDSQLRKFVPFGEGVPGGSFTPRDMELMRGALDAVCFELGIGPADGHRRDRAARRIIASYETGRRAPLYLVHAGLSEQS